MGFSWNRKRMTNIIPFPVGYSIVLIFFFFYFRHTPQCDIFTCFILIGSLYFVSIYTFHPSKIKIYPLFVQISWIYCIVCIICFSLNRNKRIPLLLLHLSNSRNTKLTLRKQSAPYQTKNQETFHMRNLDICWIIRIYMLDICLIYPVDIL